MAELRNEHAPKSERRGWEEERQRRAVLRAQKRRELAERLAGVAIAEYERMLMYGSAADAIERVLAEENESTP